MPNIFNVVVKAVIHQWGYLVAEGDGSDGRKNSSSDEASQPARQTIRVCDDRKRWTEGGHTRLKSQSELFYEDNRMTASTRPVWLQTAFDTLKGLFDWVGLKTNL